MNEIHVSQVKCTQYWPDNVGFTEKFGYMYISVTLTRSTTHADYTIRDFEMQTASVAYTVYTHTLWIYRLMD